MNSSDTANGVSNAKSLWERLIRATEVLFPSLAERRRQSGKKLRQQGVEALSAGNRGAAIAYLLSAIECDPTNSSYYCDLAQIHYEAEEYAQAKELYTTALKHDYVSLNALKGLGHSLHSLQKYDEAIYYYLRYLHENPKEPNIVLNLAVVLHNTGKYLEAADYYAQAQELEPQNAVIPENRGIALYSAGKFDEAIPCFNKAIQLNPVNAEAHKFLAFSLLSKGDTEQALKNYRKVLELTPDSGTAHLDVGVLLGKRGQHAEAAAHATEAVRILQSSNDTDTLARAYWELGWHQYKLENWTESIEASRSAIGVNPGLVEPRFNLALALLHIHQVSEARDEYEKGSAEVKLASELELWAIDDLRRALLTRPSLPGASEILMMLERRYDELGQSHGLRSIARSVELN